MANTSLCEFFQSGDSNSKIKELRTANTKTYCFVMQSYLRLTNILLSYLYEDNLCSKRSFHAVEIKRGFHCDKTHFYAVCPKT